MTVNVHQNTSIIINVTIYISNFYIKGRASIHFYSIINLVGKFSFGASCLY